MSNAGTGPEAGQSYKVCPRYGLPAELTASVCVRCGRQYRTVFVPANPSSTQTQVFSPSPRPSVPYPPVAPAVAPSAGVSAGFLLEECSNQYRRYTEWFLLSVLFMPGLIGVILYLYLTSLEGQLRQKVAMLGVDPKAWEAPLRRERNRALVRMLAILFIHLAPLAIYAVWQARKLAAGMP